MARIMKKTIHVAKLSPEMETEFLYLQAVTVGEMWKEGDTLLDDLNRIIEFIMGKSILSYYIPCDTNEASL